MCLMFQCCLFLLDSFAVAHLVWLLMDISDLLVLQGSEAEEPVQGPLVRDKLPWSVRVRKSAGYE